MINFIKIKKIIDKKGDILPIEYNKLPFKIKRTYILNNMPKNIIRGGHAHKKLNQIIFCLAGKIKILLKGGGDTKQFIITPDTNAIWLKSGIWREIKNLNKNTVIMVLASDNYKESDYIRNYEKFLHYKMNKKN